MQKDHGVTLLGHGDVVVDDVRQPLGEFGQLVVVGGKQRLGTSRGWLWMYSTTAHAIDRPS